VIRVPAGTFRVEASYDSNQPQIRVPGEVIEAGSFLCAEKHHTVSGLL
jgi:hypothetical protein